MYSVAHALIPLGLIALIAAPAAYVAMSLT